MATTISKRLSRRTVKATRVTTSKPSTKGKKTRRAVKSASPAKKKKANSKKAKSK
jgi:hypothetical protein